MVALAHSVRRNDLGFGVYRAERPDVAKCGIVVERDMLFLLANETPNLIEL